MRAALIILNSIFFLACVPAPAPKSFTDYADVIRRLHHLEVENAVLQTQLDDKQCIIDRTTLSEIEECLGYADFVYGCLYDPECDCDCECAANKVPLD